ncbi:hypothetical protein VNO80_02344 [Phaseolus coccineus]|uniref:Uncharacterized protein n=1 Tax=Phaseolus coccineus TaxID=3886 RepID=A0AAN9RMB0_PHACN
MSSGDKVVLEGNVHGEVAYIYRVTQAVAAYDRAEECVGEDSMKSVTSNTLVEISQTTLPSLSPPPTITTLSPAPVLLTHCINTNKDNYNNRLSFSFSFCVLRTQCAKEPIELN